MLDIKSKSSNRVKGIVISFILLSVIAVGAILTYRPIYDYAKTLSVDMESESKKSEQINNKQEFVQELYRGNYSLYWDLQKKIKNSDLTPSEVLFNKIAKEAVSTQDDSEYYDDSVGENQQYEKEFNTYFKNEWHDRFLTLVINDYQLDYYIIDNKTGETLTNTTEPLQLIKETSENAQRIKDKYSFYTVLNYGENSAIEIPVLYGLEDSYKSDYLSYEYDKSLFQENPNYGEEVLDNLISPSDVTIIYASKNDNIFSTQEHSYNNYSMKWTFSNSGFNYVYLFAVLITILAALLLPIKKSWQLGEGITKRIPFEVAFISVIMMLAFYEYLLFMAVQTAAGTFANTNLSVFPEWVDQIFIYGFNYLGWLCVLSVWFVCVLSVRQVFSIGLIQYLIEKTWTISFLSWVKNKIKKWFQAFRKIDIKDPVDKTIVKILVVNFIILTILCSIWVMGIVGLIIYTIVLFIIMKKYLTKLKSEYMVLQNTASRMAEGDLEIIREEDLGIFEPLKQELTKVQYGFKKAVEEEMKSQKMKSELITNVSHDLKTPLTAIITYVGLLKDTAITEEERISYIDTLDKKSQRLKVLIEDLFEISKASSNNITLNRIDMDITSLIKQVLFELDDKVNQADIEFRVNMPKEKVILNLDSEKTYRIVENLIINITKYSLPHTRAYIDMEINNERVSITFKNISAIELDFNPDEICERFERGDKARNTEGSGLGLAIVKSFVELQGGTFKVVIDGDLFKAVIEWKK